MQFGDDFPMMLEVEASHSLPNGGFVKIPDGTAPVAVAFGYAPLRDPQKSAVAGHDVYTEVEFVKIAVPGDKHSFYFQPATDVHKARFPKAYAAFKERGMKPLQGMPIEQWAPISRSLAMTLKAAHIHTVEALAEVHDGNIAKLGFNARELREKARAWLAEAKDSAATMQLAAEKKALEDQLAAMRAQIEALQAAQANPNVVAAPRPQMTVAAPMADPTADVEADVVRAARRPRARA